MALQRAHRRRCIELLSDEFPEENKQENEIIQHGMSMVDPNGDGRDAVTSWWKNITARNMDMEPDMRSMTRLIGKSSRTRPNRTYTTKRQGAPIRRIANIDRNHASKPDQF